MQLQRAKEEGDDAQKCKCDDYVWLWFVVLFVAAYLSSACVVSFLFSYAIA